MGTLSGKNAFVTGTSQGIGAAISKALIDAGYADRLCPSHDCSLAHVLPEGETVEQRESNNPYRYLYIKKVVFPWLREMGIAESIISRLCIDGPRNFFEGK